MLSKAVSRVVSRRCIPQASRHCSSSSSGRAAPIDVKALFAEGEAANEAFEAHAETLKKVIPTEYARFQDLVARQETIRATAEEAHKSGDASKLEAAAADLNKLTDEFYTEAVDEATRMAQSLKGRSDYRENVWAKEALSEDRTSEAYGLHADAGAIGSSGLVEKYGLATLVGSAAAIAVSKEIYVLNEELLVAGCFSAFIGTAYVALREQVNNDVKTGSDELLAEYQAAVDRYARAVRVSIDYFKDTKEVGVQFATLAEYFKGLEAKFLATRPVFFRNVAKEIVERELARFEQSEANFMATFPPRIADEITADVTETMEAESDDARRALIDDAIARIAGDKKTAGADPVRKHYETAVATLITRWAKLRDADLVVPEDVRTVWQAKLNEHLETLDVSELETPKEFEGVGVVSAKAKADEKALLDQVKKSAVAPRRIRYVY